MAEAAPAFSVLFQDENLPAPPLPSRLQAALHVQGRTVLATRSLTASPYALEAYLSEFESQPDLPDYAVIGFDGHGFNSWAAHCYVVDEALALFIQLPWGGAFTDADEARDDIADAFAWAKELQSKIQQAKSESRIPQGWRLEVAMSRRARSGWRWLAPGRDNAAQPWNPSSGMKAAILRMLDEVIAGARKVA